MNNRKYVLTALLIIIVAFYFFKNTNKKDFLSEHFPNGYSSEAVKVGEDLIIYADADASENCDENPLVYLIRQGEIKSVFEIIIGDFCVTNDKFIVSGDLVISEWIGSAFGSGGFRGLILWKITNGELQPVGGYPNDSEVFGTAS